MKYTVRVDHAVLELDVEDEGDGSLLVTAEGRSHRLDLVRVGSTPLHSLLIDGESLEVVVEPLEGGYLVGIGGELFEALVRPGGRRPLEAEAGAGTGELVIKSPMTGVIAAVQVQPGQEVERGQVLVVVEAMKMNNEIRAPRAGKVREVRVAPGRRVEQQAVLVVLI